jgi:PAS domain S-box-containing protein
VPLLLAAIKDVPRSSLILYQYFRQQTPGQRMDPQEVAPLMANAARVPVYGTSDTFIGSGVVGGVMRDTRESGNRLGEIALRILSGTRAQDIPIEDVHVVPILDGRAMQRWGISESRLPPGSVIRFRAPSLWRDYRDEALAALGALVLQSLLIIALLYQRRARQRAEVKLAGIIEGSDDAIVSKDLSTTILSWNRGAERIFGYTTQEMIGRSIRTIIPEDRRSEEEEVLRKIRRGEKVSHYETVRRRKDGSEVHVSLTISPIYSNAGVIVGASKIARDISDRKRAEVESRHNLALAADANRRATVTALTGSIAHELGQPLNAILHNAQAGEMLIASNRAKPETLLEILADIRKADTRATEIIERHRTMLRSRQLDPRPVDIHAIVRESVALVAHDTKSKHVQVDVDLPLDPCFVAGDPVLLQQVVVNLLMNAIDAMADTPTERRRILVQSDTASGNVEVAVRDAGTGLPASVDGKLFEPFVTTKTNGMGIGLNIARTIIEAHRGTIAARNNPEGGATFTVVLRRAETPVMS